MGGLSITRSKALRIGATALAGGIAAACGVTAETGSRTTTTATQGPATPAPRNVTLIVDNDWINGDRLTVVKAWLERANQVYPNIKTDLRDVAGDQAKTIALFASDSQGDLYQMDQHLIPVFGPKNVLFDISPTLASLKFDADNLLYDVHNITHYPSPGGPRHGLLVQLGVQGSVYMKNAFQEAGVKEPTAEWTWDDYLEAAKKLGKPTDNRWGTNVVPGYPYSWFWSAGVPYMDAKGTKTSWDSSASREILQWLTDLAQRHRVAPTPAEAAEKKLSFNTGNYAIAFNTVATPAISRAIDGKFQWALAPTPRNPKTGKAVTLVSGHNYLITKKAANRGVTLEAAQVLIEFFSTQIQEMYISGLNVSTLSPLKTVTAKASSMPGMPDMKLALDAIPTGQNFDKVPGFLDFHNAFGPEFTRAVNGEDSVEQVAINMTRLSDAALNNAAR
jgi:ABC-type glycerol-3-phosphate transport system substrate-binding protein